MHRESFGQVGHDRCVAVEPQAFDSAGATFGTRRAGVVCVQPMTSNPAFSKSRS
jgi:hypothetical protein